MPKLSDLVRFFLGLFKGGINLPTALFCALILAIIAFKIGSCGKSEPIISQPPKIDSVSTTKEIPFEFKEAVKSEKPKQSLLSSLLKPSKEAEKITETKVVVQHDTIFKSFLQPSRFLVYRLKTEDETIVTYSLDAKDNALLETRFVAPEWWRDFEITTGDDGVHIYYAGNPFVTWEGLNLLAEFIAVPEKSGKAYLWTGLRFSHLSFQAFFTSKGEVGMRTNYRF